MIVVCGEALIDLFLGHEDGPRIAAQAVAGGSPYNVSIGLKRQGIASAFFGGLSKDTFGQFLARRLEAEGVSLALAHRTARPSPIMIVATDAKGHPAYTFLGENAAHEVVPRAALPDRLADDVAAITFGSFAMSADPTGATYLALAEREGQRRVISIDPNVRPMATADMGLWRERFETFKRTATIIKASVEDIELMEGHGADVARVAERWRADGPAIVIVTRGEHGALAFAGGAAHDIPGRKVAVVDTVGAGDTFHATLLAELARMGKLTPAGVRGLDRTALDRILRTCVSAASITCTRRGADLPTAADIAAASG